MTKYGQILNNLILMYTSSMGKDIFNNLISQGLRSSQLYIYILFKYLLCVFLGIRVLFSHFSIINIFLRIFNNLFRFYFHSIRLYKDNLHLHIFGFILYIEWGELDFYIIYILEDRVNNPIQKQILHLHNIPYHIYSQTLYHFCFFHYILSPSFHSYKENTYKDI